MNLCEENLKYYTHARVRINSAELQTQNKLAVFLYNNNEQSKREIKKCFIFIKKNTWNTCLTKEAKDQYTKKHKTLLKVFPNKWKDMFMDWKVQYCLHIPQNNPQI